MPDPAGPNLQKPPGYRDPAAPPAPRAPPKKPPLPPTLRNPGKPIHNPRRRRRSVCCRLCCCLFLLLFSLIFLLAVAGAVSYLYFQPRLPSFRLQSLQSPKFNISGRGGVTSLDAVTAVKIFAANPNAKIGLSYGGSKAEVYVTDEDGDVAVGSGSAAGFDQGVRNATVVRFSAAAKGVLVDDAVAARLKGRVRSKEIRFGVEVRIRVGFRVRGRATWRVPIRVVCRPVSLKAASKGGAALPKCDINFLGWMDLR